MEASKVRTLMRLHGENLGRCSKHMSSVSRSVEEQTIGALKELLAVLDRPEIVCLCGSTRFTDEMLLKQWELSKLGYIVLGWCALPGWYHIEGDRAHLGDREGVEEVLDAVHLRKVALSDWIFVVNVGGYIGESTQREIEYAKSLGKVVRYLEEVGHEYEQV